MTRWKAALIHLALSILIVGSTVTVVTFFWYPLSLLHVTSLDRLIGMIAAVDLTVGPFLTLVVYKHGKRGLRLDLTLIGLAQAALLAYGLYALGQNRPVFLVGAIDRFELVSAREIAPEDLRQAQPPFDHLSWSGAETVGVRLPTDNTALIDETLSGRDVHVQPKYYVPYDDVRSGLSARARPVSDLLAKLDPTQREVVVDALEDRPVDSVRYLPMNTAAASATVLVDGDAEPIGVLAVDPW